MKPWNQFLKILRNDLGPEAVDRWIRTLKVLKFDAANLYLEAEDHFQALWFDEHIRPKAEQALLSNGGTPIKIHLSIANDTHSLKRGKNTKKLFKPAEENAFELQFDPVDLSFTFNSWVPIQKNKLPYQTLADLSGFDLKTGKIQSPVNPLGAVNPIYLYGSSGSGKTHLLSATADSLRKQHFNVIYCRGETFTNHVVYAIRQGEMSTFRRIYRTTDVLILDDIDSLSKKSATQEEFFHTFNSLHLAGKQIIISASVPPHELKGIEARLISRFQWGLSLPIYGIEKENLFQVLEKKTELHNFPLHQKVSDLILDRFSSSPKSISKALDALILRTHLDLPKGTSPTTLSTAYVEKTLLDLIEKEKLIQLKPEGLIETIANYYGIQPDVIKGKSQKKDVVVPRQIAMYLCRKKLQMPLMQIGELLNRDHSTVMASIRKIEKSMSEGNREVLGSLHSIEEALEKRQSS